MTLDEAINHAEEVAEQCDKECKKVYPNAKSKCAAEYRQIVEWLKDYKQLKEQELCEDDYIKVPKKALKYRTAGMVAYNAEWLKNHFDIERAVICGAQQPILDKIRAEIEQLPITDTAIKLVAEILDKYKAESEEV